MLEETLCCLYSQICDLQIDGNHGVGQFVLILLLSHQSSSLIVLVTSAATANFFSLGLHAFVQAILDSKYYAVVPLVARMSRWGSA